MADLDLDGGARPARPGCSAHTPLGRAKARGILQLILDACSGVVRRGCLPRQFVNTSQGFVVIISKMLLKGFALAAALSTLASSGLCLCADESEGRGDHPLQSHSSSGESGGHDHSHHHQEDSEPSHSHGGSEESCVTTTSDLFSDCQPQSLEPPSGGILLPALYYSGRVNDQPTQSSLDERLAGVLTRRGTPPLYLTLENLTL
jgi:hypothetical protein